jgi:hypothetical protein
LGHFQKNPRELLDTPVERGLVTGAALTEAIPDGMSLFVDEFIDFSRRHLPELEPYDFFQKLLGDPDVKIPLLIPILNPDVRQYPGWIAYESLRTAIAAKFPPLA